MTDREKVIDGLEKHITTIEASGDGHKWRFVQVETIEAALELLKEYVNPLRTKQSIFGSNYVCAKCKRYLFPAGRYCPHCGRAVKWDDSD